MLHPKITKEHPSITPAALNLAAVICCNNVLLCLARMELLWHKESKIQPLEEKKNAGLV
jgi:hypothetical protein